MIAAVLDVSEFTVTFNIMRFIRIFIYHLLFFYIGPFMLPLTFLIDSTGLAGNMGFWVKTSTVRVYVIQHILWLIGLFLTVMQYLRYMEEKGDIKGGPYLKGIYFE
jgi:hypothetical protein